MIDITKLYDYDNGTLLEALNDERGKFTRSDKSLMGVLIEELIQRRQFQGTPTQWQLWFKDTEPGGTFGIAAISVQSVTLTFGIIVSDLHT